MLLVVKRKTKTLRKQARSRIICESCTERREHAHQQQYERCNIPMGHQ